MDAEDIVGLVRGALAGDRRAVTRLVAVLTPTIHGRVARTLFAHRAYLGDGNFRQAVEDLVQEVFLSLFADDARVLRGWKPELSPLASFAGMIGERRVFTFLRNRKRNPRTEDLAERELAIPSVEPGPYAFASSREELQLLLDRLEETLSPLGRHVFELLFVQELSPLEVMAATELSADAVYAWSSRLRRLAQQLQVELSGSAVAARKSSEES